MQQELSCLVYAVVVMSVSFDRGKFMEFSQDHIMLVTTTVCEQQEIPFRTNWPQSKILPNEGCHQHMLQ